MICDIKIGVARNENTMDIIPEIIGKLNESNQIYSLFFYNTKSGNDFAFLNSPIYAADKRVFHWVHRAQCPRVGYIWAV